MSALPSVSSATTNMEPEWPPQTENLNAHQARGSNSGGEIPVVGNSIGDPARGKSCHQCHQKIKGLFASCKNLRKGKPCKLKFCRACLKNRYGADAQQVGRLDDWSCPRCQGQCNCCTHKSEQGREPIGALMGEAKASGFGSVSELLGARAAANLDTNTNNDAVVFPPKEIGLKDVSSNDTSVEYACQNQSLKRPKICSEVPEEETKRSANVGSLVCNEVSENNNHDIVNEMMDGLEACGGNDTEVEKVEEIPLPPSTQLNDILGMEFPHEDVGSALQFLEFCRVFGKTLDMKQGEAQTILRELIHKQNLRNGDNTLTVEFQTRLLNLVLINSGHKSPSLTTIDGNSSWLKALGDLASQPGRVLKDFPLGMLNDGLSGYCNLSLSHKLSLLNLICDVVLCTDKLRSYIREEDSKIKQQKKEAKAQVAAAKEKEKSLKQKLQEETAKTVQSNADPVSLSEQNAIVQKLRTDVARAHTEMLEAKGKTPKRKVSEAMRIEPEFVDGCGRAFWKLKSYEGEDAVLLQDIKIHEGDGTAIDERWFVYGPEKKHEIDKYISSRAKRTKPRKAPYKL